MRIIVPTDHEKSNSSERATIMRTRMELEEETEWRRVPDPDTEEERTTQTSDTKNDFVSNENETKSGKMEKRSHRTGSSPPATDEGYNSSEEHESKIMRTLTALRKGNTVNTFELFAENLKSKKGFVIKKMAEDGNCLFRSIADQIYGDPEMHDQVRSRCMDYMYAEREHFSQFVTEDITAYIQRKRQNQCYGNNLEIQAIGELYNRPIEIYTLHDATQEIEQVNLFHGQYSTDNPPIRLSYHNRNHYNSVIDPNNPAVGVGLGLPQLQPGVCLCSVYRLYWLYSQLADKMLLKEAIDRSEAEEMEEQLVTEYKNISELELTEQQLDEAIVSQYAKESEEALLEQQIQQAILLQSQHEYFQQLHKHYNL